MPHCPDCGEEFSTNQSFCRNCGNDLSDFNPAESQHIKELSNANADTVIDDSIPNNYLSEIDDEIKPDETIHYAYRVNAAERGEDHMGGITTGGCLLATDRRLTAYINETIGSSNISINYDRITTVEIEHGAVVTKLSVQSTSKTYSFPGFNTVDKSDIHNFADFIRDKTSETRRSNDSDTDIDPTEQLKNIKELHEQDVLTDGEFEKKKQSLLDKL